MGAMKDLAIEIGENNINEIAQNMNIDKYVLWDCIDEWSEETGDDWMSITENLKAVTLVGADAVVTTFENVTRCLVDLDKLTFMHPSGRVDHFLSRNDLMCTVLMRLLAFKGFAKLQ